uniref:proline-rich receptor-like protein kinase PERK15 isoform X1 n=1 Tax=Fragaria vesca subsp. vesca TaxID=101020 RepID=UPI0005CA7E78|nr:PREDICTED: proline-rich receptor-like protein kinase PERK15 isoform X1 [Fragaria vesca subsp. vesca]
MLIVTSDSSVNLHLSFAALSSSLNFLCSFYRFAMSSPAEAPVESPPESPSEPPPSEPPPESPSEPPPESPSEPPPESQSEPPPESPSEPPPESPSEPPPESPSEPPPESPSEPPPESPSEPPALPPATQSGVPPENRYESTTPPVSSVNLVKGITSSKGTSVGLIIGCALGGILLVLVAVGIFIWFVRYRRKRKKSKQRGAVEIYYGDFSGENKDDPLKGPPQNLQQNYTPPSADKIEIYPMPTHSRGPSSTGSGYGSEKPSSAFGFSESTFTYQELAMATNGFSSENLLGQGGFGYVHKGVLPNGKVVAIKQLKAGSGQGEREFQAEVEVINRVHHRHLVSLVGYCISGAQRLLVYEFVSNNTLEFHLHGMGRPTMTWPMRMKIALGSAKGLAYLHEDCHPKIIHRDIKAANILIDENFEAKVADFGLAKLALDTDTHVSTRVMGTFGYLAPEYASSGKLSDKSDVFSFGVVLLELITGHRPIDKTHSFTDDSMVEWARPLLAQALEKGNFDGLVDARLQNDYNSSEMACMVACAAACVRHSARHRPKMSQVLRALEGNLSPDELNEGVIPGHSMIYSSSESTQYSTQEYKQDMLKFRKLALEESQELDQGISETSGPSSDFGQHQSASSGEGQQTTKDIEYGRTDKDTQDFGKSS